jgi:23S rRNA pseudouridine955/2504/2580 synthase
MIPALYQDEDILVLDKPAGLASQPGAGVGLSLVEAVERDYGFRPFLVHRLDKETAGCILVAKSSKAAARWTADIASRSVGKFYRAVVSGSLDGRRGRIVDPVPVRGEEKAGETLWRLVGRFGAASAGSGAAGEGPGAAGGAAAPFAPPGGYSYLELELGTGRTHQIRLHLAGSGAPILGDDRHGDFALNKRLRKELGLKRLLLLAWRLELPGGRSVRASVPDYLRAFLAAFPDAPDPEAP